MAKGLEFAGTASFKEKIQRLEDMFDSAAEDGTLIASVDDLRTAVKDGTKPSHRGINRAKFNMMLSYAVIIGSGIISSGEESSEDVRRYATDQETTYPKEMKMIIGCLSSMEQYLKHSTVHETFEYFKEVASRFFKKEKLKEFNRLNDLAFYPQDKLYDIGKFISSYVSELDEKLETGDLNIQTMQMEAAAARRLHSLSHQLTSALKEYLGKQQK